MYGSITPPEWYRKVNFGRLSPWAIYSYFSLTAQSQLFMYLYCLESLPNSSECKEHIDSRGELIVAWSVSWLCPLLFPLHQYTGLGPHPPNKIDACYL